MSRSRTASLAWIFATTIFLSAFLLFEVQPILSKYILPWFGGSPAVWTTCMVFFQTVLFLGYGYAHWSQRTLSPRVQGIVHLMLLLAAVLLLPIAPEASWKPSFNEPPTWRILALLSVCVGLPYLALSATGPLLQAWFSRAYPQRSPYRLYALSNAGSLLALLKLSVLCGTRANGRQPDELLDVGIRWFRGAVRHYDDHGMLATRRVGCQWGWESCRPSRGKFNNRNRSGRHDFRPPSVAP